MRRLAAAAPQRPSVSDVAAAFVQYGLLGGFAAARISALGLIGFARDNMGLHTPWPYLLFFALDGPHGRGWR